jgi:hypothetical protein
MSHRDHQKLIDRGRKAGLRTAELYQAMSAERTQEMGQADVNGYIQTCGADGRRVFKPSNDLPRS